MIRKEAVEIVCKFLKDEIVVSANGFISRDVFSSLEKNSNFYMLGSMGLASSIGLGIALKKPKKKIFVFDGDGNILMNLGSLVTIGSLHSRNNNISKIAKINDYSIFTANTKKTLENTMKRIQKIKGPILIHVHITKSKEKSSRVDILPKEITNRFMNSIK